jgi:hypothetical protein
MTSSTSTSAIAPRLQVAKVAQRERDGVVELLVDAGYLLHGFGLEGDPREDACRPGVASERVEELADEIGQQLGDRDRQQVPEHRSDASLIVVRQTLPTLDLGIFGDGVVVLPYEGASVQPGDTALLEGHARSNVASFGGAITVTRLRGRCSAFDLATESYAEIAAVLEDGGDNLCGCPDATSPCQATSSMLAPPAPSPEL